MAIIPDVVLNLVAIHTNLRGLVAEVAALQMVIRRLWPVVNLPEEVEGVEAVRQGVEVVDPAQVLLQYFPEATILMILVNQSKCTKKLFVVFGSLS